jgi:hypothetical protein
MGVMKRLHSFFLLGLGLAGVVACATQSESNPGSVESDILNGNASDRREVVLLGDKSSGCSGTLIAPDVVLTAAHCSDYRTVNVGYSKRTTSSEEAIRDPGPDDTYRRYRVVERVNMPGFVNSGCPMTGAADVALLRLAEPVVDPTMATLADRAPEIGEECLVVGYGRHNADDNLETVEDRTAQWTYGERREARVTIFEKGGRGIPRADAGATEAGATDAGSNDYDGGGADAGAQGAVAPTVDWFSAKGIDGAHSRGDSGGAIFCGGKLAGVVSCSVDRNQKILDLVKVYGNVETSRVFIDETMRKWRENPLPPPDAGADAASDASIADAAGGG